MPTLFEAYKDALHARESAGSAEIIAGRMAFPVGATVQWMHGDSPLTGVVIKHGFETRVKVRGVTGAEYWIYAHRIIYVKEES